MPRTGPPAGASPRRRWSSTEDLRATTVPGGHFVPEESPQEVAELLGNFLGRDVENGRVAPTRS